LSEQKESEFPSLSSLTKYGQTSLIAREDGFREIKSGMEAGGKMA
jgi:hypothetical protein